jgi:hypothetical protein
MVLYESINILVLKKYKYCIVKNIMNTIFEKHNSLNDIICESIIELFEKNIFYIPKNNKEWERIERTLYKEILIGLNEYKMNLMNNINLNNELITLLNNDLYTKDICIQKIDIGENITNKYNLIPNRYNVITYIFYLNDIKQGGEVVFYNNDMENKMINPEKGKLVLFPEDINLLSYKCCAPIENVQYIISGQLYYDNNINY